MWSVSGPDMFGGPNYWLADYLFSLFTLYLNGPSHFLDRSKCAHEPRRLKVRRGALSHTTYRHQLARKLVCCAQIELSVRPPTHVTPCDTSRLGGGGVVCVANTRVSSFQAVLSSAFSETVLLNNESLHSKVKRDCFIWTKADRSVFFVCPSNRWKCIITESRNMVIVLCATYSVFTKLSALEDPGTVFYSIQISTCIPPFLSKLKWFFYI